MLNPIVCDRPRVWAVVDSHGEAWCMRGHARPSRRGITVAAVRDFLEPGETLRVLAVPRNAPLIRATDLDVEVARPLWFRRTMRAVAKDGPAALLVAIAEMAAIAPVCGGWRPVTAADRAAFAAADALARGDDAGVLAALAEHPIDPYLRFLDPCDRLAVGMLVAEILDPRYFVEAAVPDSQKPLRAFLGLADLEPGGEARARRDLVRAAWKCGDPGRAAEQPGGFLWRIWWRGGQRDHVADRAFASFLRAAWLESVTATRVRPGTCRGLHGPLVPEHLLADPRDAAALSAHLARLPAAV